MPLNTPHPGQSQRLRLNTLVRLRWLAIVGQSITVVIVAYGLSFPFPVIPCFALIACSAALNVYLALHYPSTHRLPPQEAFVILTFDALQLAGLLYMTGGLTNPFSLLMAVPVVVSATSLPLAMTALLGGMVVAMATLLAFFHLPLPWYDGAELAMPFIYVAGTWVALSSSIAFTGIYAFRVAEEARLLANALSATELVLQREQHLSALDGSPPPPRMSLARRSPRSRWSPARWSAPRLRPLSTPTDVKLLRSQSERCREILKQLTSLSSEGEAHLARLPLTSLVEEVTAPHRDFGIAIKLEPGERHGPEPVGRRNPGVIYGLGNLVENAVDFAKKRVTIGWRWNDEEIAFSIVDDGPGFPPEIVSRIGEPYMSTRQGVERGGGLGLGLFIAKTLLERSGATLSFRNSNTPGEGALVEIVWPRAAFLAPMQAAEPMFDTA